MNIYEAYWTDSAAMGLKVTDGRLTLAGQEFFGAGVNSYNLFLQCLPDFSLKKAERSLQILRENGMHFVRFSISPYYYDEMPLFTDDPQRYFDLLAGLADLAEQLEIGLIPSFFWHNNTVPNYFDEPFRAWGRTDSQTFTFLKSFTRGAVSALAKSKAVWGWEFGNEFDLSCDLPNAAEQLENNPLPEGSSRPGRTEEDFLTASDVRTASAAFAEIVRENDPEGRMISSGFASMRPSQYNQTHFGTWTQDTPQERLEITAFLHPEGVDVVSEHVYFTEQTTFGRLLTLSEYLEEVQAIATSLGKAYIIGEWGNDTDACDAFCADFISAVLENKIQLTMVWNFNLEPGVEHSFTADSERGQYLLGLVRDLDAELQRQ